MTLQIIGGRFKKKRLLSVDKPSIRPTTSIVRKAVFDMVRPFIDGASFLDICAGSGAMGLEALSQGAKESIFIEKDPQVVAILKKNIAACHVEKESRVISLEAIRAIRKISCEKFSIIYLDPPYKEIGLYEEILPLLFLHQMIEENGFLFIESSEEERDLGKKIESLLQAPFAHRRFGTTRLTICRPGSFT